MWYRYCMAEVGSVPPATEVSARFDDLAERRLAAMRLALAERRRALGLSMSSLAREVGVSPSMVSQIERGQTLPSVATLFALVTALGVDIDALFETSGDDDARPAAKPERLHAEGREALPPRQLREDRYVVRHDRRPTIAIQGGISWERLSPAPLEALEFFELVYAPGAASSEELYRHPGTEMLLVLEGAFRIHVGFEEYLLERGDSMQFPSSLPHRYVNAAEGVSRAVTVVMPDVHAGEAASSQLAP